MSFKDKLAVITGGSSGLGQALALRLHAQGAHVALVARDAKKLESVRKSIPQETGQAGKVEAFSCDVAKADATTECIGQIADTMGSPEVLINCAGILREGPFSELSLDTIRQVMEINYFGAVHCTKAALPYFLDAGSGRIVNICSMAGRAGVYGYSAYCSSKHALMGLSGSLRCELKPQNIKVQIAYPPEFESPMVDDLNTYRSEANRVMVQTIPVMKLDQVADEIIKGMENDQYEIIPGIPSKLVARVNNWFPWLTNVLSDFRIKQAFVKGRGEK